MEKCVDYFGVFFVERYSKRSWVYEDYSCFSEFWTPSNDVINLEVLFLCVTYLGRFLGDEKGINKMRERPILARVMINFKLLK